jgi:hypothetical protein
MSEPVVRFLDRSNQRQLPVDYTGDVFVWDIDKTYLDTRFSSVRGLLAIPFELAVDKVALPGAIALLRALRRGPGEKSRVCPLYFVSGSPPQLRRVVEKKMVLDSVDFDGITFKDQWGLVRARRFSDVKGQVGYKLKALLLYRREIPLGARFFFFGDDVEQDAYVFTLFGRVCAGLRGDELWRELESQHVHKDDREEIRALLEDIPLHENPVEKVFIHLTEKSDPASFTDERVVPVHSFLQATLVLGTIGRVAATGVLAVASDIRRSALETEIGIEQQLTDARTRLGVDPDLVDLVRAGR